MGTGVFDGQGLDGSRCSFFTFSILSVACSGQELQDSWGCPVAGVSSGCEELSVDVKVLAGPGEGDGEDQGKP